MVRIERDANIRDFVDAVETRPELPRANIPLPQIGLSPRGLFRVPGAGNARSEDWRGRSRLGRWFSCQNDVGQSDPPAAPGSGRAGYAVSSSMERRYCTRLSTLDLTTAGSVSVKKFGASACVWTAKVEASSA